MSENTFRFYTRLNQIRLLDNKAKNIVELLENIKIVGGSSIYYHTHRFLVKHHFLKTGPVNDFAYWVEEFLGENVLAEKLASIYITDYSSIADLRYALISKIAQYLSTKPRIISVSPEKEFRFMSCRTFILPTSHIAKTLPEFIEKIKHISIHSIYFHLFEARLRLAKPDNDFSIWLRDTGFEKAAEEISKLDPYTDTLYGIREKIVRVLEENGH